MPYRRRRAKRRYRKKYVRRTAGISTYHRTHFPRPPINWKDWGKMKIANTVANAGISAFVYPTLKGLFEAWKRGNHFV